jgi:hypothetical protein
VARNRFQRKSVNPSINFRSNPLGFCVPASFGKSTRPIIPMHTDQKTSPLAELRRYLAECAQSCRENRWLRAWFKFTVAEEIVADVVASHAVIAQKAYTAQQSDLEGASEVEAARAELEAALQGGLDNSDAKKVVSAMGRLKLARRHVLNSAANDRQISEVAHAT